MNLSLVNDIYVENQINYLLVVWSDVDIFCVSVLRKALVWWVSFWNISQ